MSAAAVSQHGALPRVLRAIAGITVVTGVVQAAWPGLVLGEL